MKRLKRLIGLFLVIFLFTVVDISYSNDYLNAWQSFAKNETGGKELLVWLRYKAESILSERQPSYNEANEAEGIKLRQSCPATPPYYGSLGLFITLMENGKNRGCYGSFYHSSDDIEEVLTVYLTGALRNDPRSEPLFADELEKIQIVLTVAGHPFPVPSLESVDISSYGIMVYTADSGLVFVPAEIKTHARLKVLCGNRPLETLYAFNTVTIKE